MPIESRREYLNAIRERYKNSSKKEKKLILNEFCCNCRYTRKHAIRILGGRLEPRKAKKAGPKPRYEGIRGVLEELWVLMGKMCSKKMKVAFILWLPYYKGANAEQKALLYKISPATIDRYLEAVRIKNQVRGISTTTPVLKHQIPIKLLDSKIKEPGFIESDTVSHCAENPAGNFVSSLTMTDLFCGWTANGASWTKQALPIKAEVKKIEGDLPFAILGFASDNGNEFINNELHEYFKCRIPAVDFVRRRPYRKNDNAHVEQKNYTHVRQLFGYERFDDPSLVPLMNEIYQVYWNPLWNYFNPVMKLVSKQRVGSKIIKKWDKPKTPCERLINCETIPIRTKRMLKKYQNSKNPFFLRKAVEKKLKQFFQKVEEIKKRKQIDSNSGAQSNILP